ncbi:MAG: hypothetical protein OHK0013_23620 [Sandaracinaceae bacterium]
MCIPRECDRDFLRGCFAADGVPLLDRFRAGDCDGDLVSNGQEVAVGRPICDGALVARFDVSEGFVWEPGQRLDQAGAPLIAPSDAFSRIMGAIGIGCTDDRPCPRLPSAPPGLRSRCVYLGVVDGEARGVCTYYADPRDDRSCLIEGAEANRCLLVGGERVPTYDGWEHGDCDEDGLINKLDPRVCSELEVIGAVETTAAGISAICDSGEADTTRCSTSYELAPDHYGCAESGGLTPFAFCCDTHADCPMPTNLDSPLRPRCVRIADAESSDGLRGACLYGDVGDLDDYSCARARTLPLGCFRAGAPTSYGSWAMGDCDAMCDLPNEEDPAVCSCEAPPPLDAGVDAGMNTGLDAAVDPDDAALDPNGDADLDVDAGAPEPAFFAGSGCRCRAGAAGAGRSTAAWALAVLALGAVLRRRAARFGR